MIKNRKINSINMMRNDIISFCSYELLITSFLIIVTCVTYLTQDGGKAPLDHPKKIMPPIETVTGSAIRLCKIHDRLAITEGIETALGVMRYERIPCWACYAANNLAKFDPPDGIESLIIYGDRDRSFTGQAAAYELARRMQARGIDVEVVLPPDVGKDWLDHWVEECA